MPTVRFFGPIRDVVGTTSLEVTCTTLEEVVEACAAHAGSAVEPHLARCVVWVNGLSPEPGCVLGPHDEVAYLSPVSGG